MKQFQRTKKIIFLLFFFHLSIGSMGQNFIEKIIKNQTQIEKLIGSKKTQEIIFNTEKIYFTRTSQLKNIKGIGDGTIKKIINIVGVRNFYFPQCKNKNFFKAC